MRKLKTLFSCLVYINVSVNYTVLSAYGILFAFVNKYPIIFPSVFVLNAKTNSLTYEDRKSYKNG